MVNFSILDIWGYFGLLVSCLAPRDRRHHFLSLFVCHRPSSLSGSGTSSESSFNRILLMWIFVEWLSATYLITLSFCVLYASSLRFFLYVWIIHLQIWSGFFKDRSERKLQFSSYLKSNRLWLFLELLDLIWIRSNFHFAPMMIWRDWSESTHRQDLKRA